MGKRKYLLIIFLLTGAGTVQAQVNSFQAADSVSADLYEKGNWKQLIAYGRKTIGGGTDFPGLRLRVAYAFFVTGNYKQALGQYQELLKKDTYNQTARYFSYYCNKYLNNDLGASYNAAYLDKETKNKEGLKPFGFIDVSAESSIKQNNNVNRDNGFYSRFGVSNRLSWRLQLEQSVAYFNQDVFALSTDRDDDAASTHLADRQREYFSKLSFAINQNFAVIGSYHYLDTKFNSITYNSNLGLLGFKYTGVYLDLQVDANFGRLDNKPLEQYNGKITFYPLGNFNLYSISKGSIAHINAADKFIFNQSAGFKLIKNTWMETNVTLGNQDDYLDADGLYVYNGVDKTTFKCGETVFYQPANHIQLQLSYTYEKKRDTYQALNYRQNSATLSIIWKF